MADFAKLFSKLDKDASTRDVCSAKEKCPKKRKPAIFVMIARSDTAEPVSGVEVDVSKPTNQKKKTGGDGMAKFDPAKLGSHVVRFNLSPDLTKKYSPLAAREAATSAEKTTTLLLLISPLPSLQVIVQRSDNHKVIGGAKVDLTGAEPLNGTTAPGSGMATFNQLKPGHYDVKVTLTEEQLKTLVSADVAKKTVLAGKNEVLTVLVHPRGKVDPTIVIGDPKVVLVRRDYMDKIGSKAKPHRLPVQLGVTAPFDGTGRLTCGQAAKIKIFDAAEGGTAKALPLSIGGGQLSQGTTLYIEGAEPSGGMNDVQLNLELQGGKATIGPPVHDKLTCVRLKLDICKWRVDHATDPALIAESDKIDKGRYVHEQNAELHHERAKLIIHKAEPASFTGKLRLQVWDVSRSAASNQVEFFEVEKPASGQTREVNPFDLSNSSIPGTGRILWVQGQAVSENMEDTALRLGLDNLPDEGTKLIEGDRVTVTVIKTTLQICQSKTTHDTDPDPMSEEDQIKKGRYLHEQDTGFHHGRALVIVKKVEPAYFAGKLILTVWDVTAKSKASPRSELFKAEEEIAKSGQSPKANPFEFDHDGAFPEKGLKLWVEGKNGKVSAALRDTEIRLGVKDHISLCGRAAVTVIRFKKLKADIPSTPAVAARAGNSPVARHKWNIADPAATKDHFDEDYTKNKPLVLIENSLTNAEQLKLSVEVEPAHVPVRWAVIRDHRPSPDGDHKDVIDLADNKEAPTLGSDAEKLTNTLLADAVGSFHICPFVNCNGGTTFEFMTKDGKRIDREPFIMMNLVLVRVLGVTNDSKGQAINCNAFPPAAQTAANFGGFSTSAGSPWTGANSGWHANATVDVIGGGNDGQRGLDRVFGGWIQHIFLNNISATYNLPPPRPLAPAPSPRTHQYAFISNLPDNTHFGKYFYIGGTERALSGADTAMCVKTAPTIDAAAILDVSPFGNEGTGGDSAVGSNGFQGGTTGAHGGGYAAPTARPGSPIGRRWIREMWDAPGIGCRRTHISAGGTLASFRFNLGFRTDLCFWTSTDLKPDPTPNGAANRLYVSVYKCTWTPDFAISFHPTTGVGTITTAKAIAVTKDPSAPNGRAVPVDTFGLETRSPFALAWYAVDART